jgi:hypothetical protein
MRIKLANPSIEQSSYWNGWNNEKHQSKYDNASIITNELAEFTTKWIKMVLY